MACEIPEPAHSAFAKKPESVQLSFDVPGPCPPKEKPYVVNGSPETAIRIIIYGFQVEITNAADSKTIFHTLSALQGLC